MKENIEKNWIAITDFFDNRFCAKEEQILIKHVLGVDWDRTVGSCADGLGVVEEGASQIIHHETRVHNYDLNANVEVEHHLAVWYGVVETVIDSCAI